MIQPPAYQTARIVYGGIAVGLRPSLRAAALLEAAFGGLETLFQRVAEFDTRTIAAIIHIATSDEGQAKALTTALANAPLRDIKAAVLPACLDLCAGLIPSAPQDNDTARSKPVPSAERITWAETYRQLFGLAAGILQWTPEAAWNATPSEIVVALAFHAKAHGIGDDSDEIDPDQAAENEALGLDPEFDRAGLASLKAKLHA